MGWAGQLAQLAALLESDPEAGMQSLGGFIRPMCSSRPEDDPSQYDREMPDEHGPMNLNESTVLARAIASKGWEDEIGSHPRWCVVAEAHSREDCRKLTDEERERLADEIEMDLL